MRKQRHTEAEITAKLDQAGAMAGQGMRHGDIAKALGVSVMTYHRWRKARAVPRVVDEADQADAVSKRDQVKRIGELHLENSRLRRLVADLLLEKMKLEESLGGSSANRRLAGRG